MINVGKNTLPPVRVYGKDETNFSKNGLASLPEAKDVCQSMAINGDYALSFALPQDDPNWQYIQCERIVTYGGQRYRIKEINDNTVCAQAIYMDASYRFLENFPDMIGKTPLEIMRRAFSGTPIHIMDEDEAKARGMEWVTDKTDVFEFSKTNPVGVLKVLMEQLAKYKAHAELYVDNYNIALVRQIGKDKPNIRISTERNAKGIRPRWSTGTMITRLYAYGKDDLPMGSVNGGKNYVESPMYSTYPRDGYMLFDDIDNPEELKAAAQAQFDPDNIDRLDQPQFSFSIDFLDTGRDGIGLGDTVTVVDRNTRTSYPQRVSAMQYYPFQRERTSITTGKPPASVADVMADLVGSYRKNKVHTNQRGELKTPWLEGLKENYRTEFNTNLADNKKEGRQTMVHDYGDIWINPNDPDQAMGIVGGVFALANSRLPNGDYNWTAFGDWTGFTADKINAGTVYTNLVNIMSENGKLQIVDSLITIYDQNEINRFEAGYKNGKYVFALYNEDGGRTIYIDNDGNADFAGEVRGGKITSGTTIEVDTDLYVGDNIYLGDPEEQYPHKTVFFNDSVSITGYKTLGDTGIIQIFADSLLVDGKRVLTTDDYNKLDARISALEQRGV